MTKQLAWLAVAHVRCTENTIIPFPLRAEKKNMRERRLAQRVVTNAKATGRAIAAVNPVRGRDLNRYLCKISFVSEVVLDGSPKLYL